MEQLKTMDSEQAEKLFKQIKQVGFDIKHCGMLAELLGGIVQNPDYMNIDNVYSHYLEFERQMGTTIDNLSKHIATLKQIERDVGVLCSDIDTDTNHIYSLDTIQ